MVSGLAKKEDPNRKSQGKYNANLFGFEKS